MRFSGMPHSPKPPIMIVAPSWMSSIAFSAVSTTLFMVVPVHSAVSALEQGLKVVHVSRLQSLDYRAQPSRKRLQLVRQEVGSLQNVSPDMERASGESRHGFPARTRKRCVAGRLVREQCGKNL